MSPGDIVFDIETKKSFDEVGGRDHFDKLGVSVIGAYVYGADLPAGQAGKYLTFEEHEVPEFQKLLEKAGRVIGFNINSFDISVLQPYISWDLKNLSPLDLMVDVERGAGFRISLDNLSEMTLGAKKSGDGMQALRWYKEGKIDEIKKYCLKDVELTKNLYEFGRANGNVLFYSKTAMSRMTIPVSWGKAEIISVRKVLRDAFQERKSVEIEYPEGNRRTVDIQGMANDSFTAYCHLRQGTRVFKIDKVLDAKITFLDYKIVNDVQFNLF